MHASHNGQRNRRDKMTIACETMAAGNNANDVMDRAELIATSVDQDWENEATLYTFSDDSVLLVTGPQCNAYETMTDAKSAME